MIGKTRVDVKRRRGAVKIYLRLAWQYRLTSLPG